MNNWTTDIADWRTLNKDLVNFYLSQAETHFKATIELSDRITTRSVSLLTIIIPITVLTTGYVLTQSFSTNPNRHLLFIAAFGLFVLLGSLFTLARLVGVRSWMVPGGQPKEILTSQMIDNEFIGTENHYVAIVLGEIERTQYKIDFTKQVNARRLKLLKWLIWIIAFAFLIVSIFVFRQVSFFV